LLALVGRNAVVLGVMDNQMLMLSSRNSRRHDLCSGSVI